MSKFIFFITILVLLFIALNPVAYAHCPLCTGAIGAAAISAKYYGLDSTIIGLLIGAFGISTGLWVGLKIKQYIKFQFWIIAILSFLLTVIPLLAISSDTAIVPILLAGKEGSTLNKVYFVNKILLGSIIGGLITFITYFLHIYIKKLNGKVLFPFQGVLLTLFFLVISGLLLHFTYST